MNINIILIKLLLNNNYYNKYNKIINLNYYKNNNKELFKIFLSLFKLQEESKKDVSLNDLSLFLYTLYPNIKEEEKYLIESTLSKVESVELNEDLALSYLEKHREQTLSTEIALKALEVSQGKAEFAVLEDLINTSKIDVEVSTNDYFVSDDLEVLLNETIESQGLRWRLNTMNKTLGSLRKGDFGFIFARPETGKTTFLASEVTAMAEQAKAQGLGCVLWLNNEEQGNKVMLRCYQAVFGVSSKDLFTNFDYYRDEYNKKLGNHLKIYDNPGMTKQDVENLCKELTPSLIIFDQIDKIRWQETERYDLKMKSIYQWARELSKGYGAFIGVCQAGGTGEGKKYLNMNDVDSSHTAKQGEADFMIGIGKTNNDGEEFQRFISISKNKLSGDLDSVAELRHGKVPVTILPEIARYEDVLKWE